MMTCAPLTTSLDVDESIVDPWMTPQDTDLRAEEIPEDLDGDFDESDFDDDFDDDFEEEEDFEDDLPDEMDDDDLDRV